jgi:hypothetical protein
MNAIEIITAAQQAELIDEDGESVQASYFPDSPGRRDDVQAAVGSGWISSSCGMMSGISVMPSASLSA